MVILWLYYGYPTVGYQPDTYWALFRFLRIIVHFCCFYKKCSCALAYVKKKLYLCPEIALLCAKNDNFVTKLRHYMELSEQEIVRRQSLQTMRDMGIDPYPAAEYEVTGYSTDIKAGFVDNGEMSASLNDANG